MIYISQRLIIFVCLDPNATNILSDLLRLDFWRCCGYAIQPMLKKFVEDEWKTEKKPEGSKEKAHDWV